MSQEEQNQSLRFSTNTHTHGICTRVTTLSLIDRVPAPVNPYCPTKTRNQFLRYSTVTQRHGICSFGALLSHKDTALVVWCSTVTHRHSICSCGALLSHKETVSVPGVLCCQTKTRYQCLWCSTVAQRHGSSPCSCDALLSHVPMVHWSLVPMVHCHP